MLHKVVVFFKKTLFAALGATKCSQIGKQAPRMQATSHNVQHRGADGGLDHISFQMRSSQNADVAG